MRWLSSGSWEQGGGRKARSQCWTSGEQTLASSKICLEEFCGIRSWRKEGPMKASLIFKDHFPQAQKWSILTSRKSGRTSRSLHRWAICFLQNSKRMHTNSGSRDRQPSRKTDAVQAKRDAFRKARSPTWIESGMDALLNGMGDSGTEDRKNAEKLNAFFASVFMSKVVFHKP